MKKETAMLQRQLQQKSSTKVDHSFDSEISSLYSDPNSSISKTHKFLSKVLKSNKLKTKIQENRKSSMNGSIMLDESSSFSIKIKGGLLERITQMIQKV